MYGLIMWSSWRVHVDIDIRADDALRYAGGILQLVGVLLAAVGIRSVRREFTSLLGIVGTVEGWNHSLRGWLRRNTARLRQWYLRRFRGHVTVVDVGAADAARASDAVAGVSVTNAQPPADADSAAKIEWLMTRVNALLDQGQEHSRQIHTERANREAAISDVRRAIEQARKESRNKLADLAGGGLRLQTWGVVCIAVGIVLSTFPVQLAQIG